MNQEEVLELREEELCDLSHTTARYLAASPLEKSTGCSCRQDWNPIASTEQAMHLPL